MFEENRDGIVFEVECGVAVWAHGPNDRLKDSCTKQSMIGLHDPQEDKAAENNRPSVFTTIKKTSIFLLNSVLARQSQTLAFAID